MNLSIDNVSKRYSEQFALKDINIQISDTNCLCLIGPSGGGKSTLLRLIAGLEAPTSGSISVGTNPLPANERELRYYRRNIGTVFQAYNLFPHLSALENIALPLRIVHGLETEAAHTKAHALLKRFSLLDQAGKRPAELSGGQNQRVAIARALAHEPSLLLFDEPTSALDPEMTAEVLDVIEELIQEGKDCIVVTHQMGFAKRVSQCTAFIANGRVAECEESDTFFSQPKKAETKRFLERVLKY